jgi:hypothetical protein
MTINRPTAENRISGSTGFTPVAVPDRHNASVRGHAYANGDQVRTILNDQQWERIAPELPKA